MMKIGFAWCALAALMACSGEQDITEVDREEGELLASQEMSSSDGLAQESDGLAQELEGATQIIHYETLATLEGSYGRIEFMTRPAIDEEDATPVVDTQVNVPGQSLRAINWWIQDGATPLEIFRALEPGAEAPQALLENHDSLVELNHREPEVREYSLVVEKLWDAEYHDCQPAPGGFYDDVQPGSSYTLVAQSDDYAEDSTGMQEISYVLDHFTPVTSAVACGWLDGNPACPGRWPRIVTFSACKHGICVVESTELDNCEAVGHYFHNYSSGFRVTVESKRNSSFSLAGLSAIVTID